MTNVQELLNKYNQIERSVNEIKTKQVEESYRLDVDKLSLQEKTRELEEKGIKFHSKEELKSKLEEACTKLESALNSAQRKLDEANL